MTRQPEQDWGYLDRVTRSTVSRGFFALTSLCVLAGLVIQIPLTARSTEGFFDSPAARVANLFAFFTILSNLLVGATCLQLALHPDTDSVAFRVIRLAGVVQIFVTGVVYWIALGDLVEYGRWESVANQLVHSVVPILGVFGWLVFGPRGRLSVRIVALSTIVPVAWLAFTLVRGPIVDWYPYPFLDVNQHGYPKVMVNVVIVALLYLVIALGALGLDRKLPGAAPQADDR